MIKGRTINFSLGGEGGKFWNKLFAEAVDSEINCMQENKVFAGRRKQTKELFGAGAVYKNNIYKWKFSSPPPNPSKK